MEELGRYGDYREYKAALDRELQKTAEGFVRIGYLLKLARDTDILRESGYGNVNDFAKAEYNIDKTMVSRFISINDRFSEGGFSDRLREQYRGFGYAKLAIMLQLPEEINEELSPSYSKSEVQAIKDEIDAERRISDLEVLMEREGGTQQPMGSQLSMAMRQLGYAEAGLYKRLHKALSDMQGQGILQRQEAAYEALAPAGEAIHSVRLQGIGRLLLSIKGLHQEVTLTNIRSGEKESHPWEELLAAVEAAMKFGDGQGAMDAERSWELTYGERFPEGEKGEVAPVQLQNEGRRQPKKQGRVTKAAPERRRAEQQGEEKPEQQGEEKPVQQEETMQQEEPVQQEGPVQQEPVQKEEPVQQETLMQQGREETLPGQMEVEDYPELLPKGAAEEREKAIADGKEEIINALKLLEGLVQAGKWENVMSIADRVKWRAAKIIRLEGEKNENIH